MILYTSPDGSTGDETQLLAIRESIALRPNTARLFRVHLTAAQFARAAAAGTLIIEIVGPAAQTLPPQGVSISVP